MTDFKIRKGLSTDLFIDGDFNKGIVEDVVLENGSWYLCTDTAELFLGVVAEGTVTLKQINGNHSTANLPNQTPSTGEGEADHSIIGAYISDETGELYFVFSDDTEESLGIVVGDDGLTTTIKVGETVYEHTDGVIELPSFITNDQLVDSYYTKDQVDSLIPEVPTKISGFQNDIGYLTDHQDISHLADKVHTHSITDITDYTAPSLDGYATEEFVNKKIAEAELADKEADLEAYYTKSEVDALIPDVSSFIKEIPGEYITESELAAKGYLTEHQSLEDYAKLSDLPSTEGLASELYVDEKVAAIKIPDVVTKVSELENDIGYITLADVPEIDIANYYNKVETESLITEAVKSVEHPAIDLSDYTTKDYIAATTHQNKYEVLPIEGMFIQYRDEEIRLNTQRVVPTHQNVGDTGNPNLYYATFRAFAPEGATQCKEGLNGNIDTEYSQLATDKYGRKYTTIWAAIASYTGTGWSLFGANSNLDKYLGFYYHFEWYNEDTLIGTDKVRVILTNDACHDDLVPDAVARRIDDKIKAIDIPKTDLTGYATETWVAEQGFAKAADIPVVNNFATKDELTAAIEGIEHPTVELDNYVTKDEIKDFISEVPSEYVTEDELNAKGYVTDISSKADNVLFTTDKYVTNSIGDFKVGDSVKGLTVAQLFAKLLKLSDTGADLPDVPDTPGEFDSAEELVDYLISKRVTMYSQDEQGNLVETPFNSTIWTQSEAAVQMNGISTIYHIKDETGNIIESGYQEATDYNEEAWLTIALPSEIDNIKVKKYDPDVSNWVEVNWAIIKTEEQFTDGYTVWTVPEEYEVMSGSTYRFVIID